MKSALVEFWPTFVLARAHPECPSVAKWFVGTSAIEALKMFYQRLDGRVPDNLFDLTTAQRTFARAMREIEGETLIAWHNYHFVSSNLVPTRDGRVPTWTAALRDESRQLFEKAVVSAGFDLRYLLLIRNPVNLFLSIDERKVESNEESWVSDRVKDLFAIVDRYRNRSDISIEIVRYEDLCNGERNTLERLLNHAGLLSSAALARGKTFFHTGEVDKQFAYPRGRIDQLAMRFGRELAIGGYTVARSGNIAYFVRRATYLLNKWRTEFANLNRVFAGDLTVNAALYRHRWSIASRIYWQLNLLIPRRRRLFRAFHRHHYGEVPVPQPRLERLLLSLLKFGGRA